MGKYKIVDYRPNGWFITYKNAKTNPENYQPLYNINFYNGKYSAYDNTNFYFVEDRKELEEYLEKCLKYLKEKYPSGKD